MEFSEILLNFRAEHNLTQVEVAELFGVRPTMISNYECKKMKPHKMHEIKFKNIIKNYK